MRVLVVSHTAFSRTNNMGKTLLSYFQSFGPEELAQLYIHPQPPTDGTVCRRYYRMTDREAVRSILFRGPFGTEFGAGEIYPDEAPPLGPDRRFGEKRKAMGYFLRNGAWALSSWNSNRLWNWLRAFDPEVVLFTAGDYTFLYRIAREIAEGLGRPLAAVCVDDYWFYNRNERSLLGRLVHWEFRRTMAETMERTSVIFTICPSMAEAYEGAFHRPCRVLHTAAPVGTALEPPEKGQVSYIGNVSFGRWEQLVRMGQALRALGREGIHVYSREDDSKIRRHLTRENGILFHGAIGAEKVRAVMGKSVAVVHTESFDPDWQKAVRFSVSTKIAESLMYGPCLIAYGPEGVASIDYLKKTGAAFVIPSEAELEEKLERILSDPNLRWETVSRARQVAAAHHDPAVNSAKVRHWLGQLGGERYE